MKTTYEIQNKYPDEEEWHDASLRTFGSHEEVRAWIASFELAREGKGQPKPRWRVFQVTREIIHKYIWGDDGSGQ